MRASNYLALRRAEDTAAGRHLGAAVHWLDLPEAPHRGYHSPAALFADLLPADDVGPELTPRYSRPPWPKPRRSWFLPRRAWGYM